MRRVDTQLLKISPDNINMTLIQQAADALTSGGLVVFPTETVYALAANIFDDEAVGRIFEVKERPSNDPLIVHIANVNELNDIAIDIPDIAFEIVNEIWAGPLTIILKKNKRVSNLVTAGLDTVAIRMPDHNVTRKLIEVAGVPITGPSANLFTRPSPTRASHVMNDLDGRVEIVIDSGATSIGVESTILDLTSAEPRVLRPGGLPLEKLRLFFPDIDYQPTYVDTSDHQTPMTPGSHLKHYSPNAKVYLHQGKREHVIQAMKATASDLIAQGQKVGIVVQNQDADAFNTLNADIVLLGETLAEMATHLFNALRQLDAQNVQSIMAYLPEREGMGLAVWDRLIRAAEGNIIECD